MNYIERAKAIATAAHQGQVDKGGYPYIGHPAAVASMVEGEDETAVAWLHDTVEDTDMTLDRLREEGFPEEIIRAVDAMTRREGEPRGEYLERVKADPIARKVKLADLRHNSDISRIPEPREKDYRRVENYQKEIEFLQS